MKLKKILKKYGKLHIMEIDYIDCLGNTQHNWDIIAAKKVLMLVGSKAFLNALRSNKGLTVGYSNFAGSFQVAYFV